LPNPSGVPFDECGRNQGIQHNACKLLARTTRWLPHDEGGGFDEIEFLTRGNAISFSLPYDLEPSGFLVSEKKLVDPNGVVSGLVLVLNELRLVVTESQDRASGTFAQQFVFLVLHDNLDKRAFYAAFRKATNSVLVAAKRCAFSSR